MQYLVALIILYVVADIVKFNRCTYKSSTKNRYIKVRFDKGLYGEYLTYRIIDKLSGDKKILVNTYIPKANGETTEIDLIMIHETGIYCFESKNYSGWIFGDESSQYWTQTLKGGKKNRFLNPIIQNKGHIKHLSEYLKDYYDGEYYSVIVFSQRCELKKVKIISNEIIVTRRPNLNRQLRKALKNRNRVFDYGKIELIYENLLSRTCVSEEEKSTHIVNIREHSR